MEDRGRTVILDIVGRSTVDSLIDWDRIPCVSIYMPTERAGRETRQGRIRLKNALDTAAKTLVVHGLRPPETETLLSPARKLLDGDGFWQHQEDGLAVFVAPGRMESFRLALPFRELLFVGAAFHIKPLLEAVSQNERFAVLALSRGSVRLLAGDRERATEIALPEDVPRSIAQALWYLDLEKQLQHRAMDRTGRGNIAVGFHGHGVPDENEEERELAFLRTIDRAVLELVDTRFPLVPAGVTEIVARYRKVSRHPRLTPRAVLGNPDDATVDELHRAAWDVVEPTFLDVRKEDRARIESGGGVRGVEAAVPAATKARVSALFVSKDDEVWGRAHPDSGEVDIHSRPGAGDQDLLDVAAIRAWSTGARVHVVAREDVPGEELAAAALRY